MLVPEAHHQPYCMLGISRRDTSIGQWGHCSFGPTAIPSLATRPPKDPSPWTWPLSLVRISYVGGLGSLHPCAPCCAWLASSVTPCLNFGGPPTRPPTNPVPPPLSPLCRPKFQPPQSEGAGRGLVPLGDQETGEQTFCCPHPPPTEMGPDRKQTQHPPPPACLRTLNAGRHMVIEVPQGADAERRV